MVLCRTPNEGWISYKRKLPHELRRSAVHTVCEAAAWMCCYKSDYGLLLSWKGRKKKTARFETRNVWLQSACGLLYFIGNMLNGLVWLNYTWVRFWSWWLWKQRVLPPLGASTKLIKLITTVIPIAKRELSWPINQGTNDFEDLGDLQPLQYPWGIDSSILMSNIPEADFFADSLNDHKSINAIP